MKQFLLTFFILLICCSCQKWNLGQKPELITYPATDISYTSVTVGGEIHKFEGDVIEERGICYGLHNQPTINDSIHQTGNTEGKFLCELTGLEVNTHYHFRAFARSSYGVTYGNELDFKTLPGGQFPVLSTIAITEITNHSAKTGGVFTFEGVTAIAKKGVCWSTLSPPKISNDTMVCGQGSGSFVCTLKSLSKNTIYYIRSFAINQQGIFYGNTLSFTTLNNNEDLPVVVTHQVNSITQTTALCGGEVLSGNINAITKRGVCWSKLVHPSLQDSITDDGSGPGLFFSILSGLDPNTNYYIRAYASSVAGTGYGQEYSFITKNLAGTLPTVLTDNVTNISINSAVSGGIVTLGGSFPVATKGVCWSNSPNPTLLDNFTQNGSGTGLFISNLSGLSENTQYFIRAYASNSAGTAYGNELNFTTIGNSGFYPGQHYGGGIIFYVDNTTQHGLIATQNDLEYVNWGCYGTYLTGAMDTAVGTGLNNTINISNACTELDFAAKVCYNLVENGFNDWYLPSKDELNLLYNNRQFVGNMITGYYWSSSEANNNEAWQENFSTGLQLKYGKYDPAAIRAIRSF